MHMASGKGLLHLAAPRLAGPLAHADQGIVCDVRGRLNVLHDMLQRDIPLGPGKLPAWRKEANVPGMTSQPGHSFLTTWTGLI